MADCSVFLDLTPAQLEVIAKVLRLDPPVVQLSPKIIRYGMLPAGKTRSDVRALYAIDLPDKPGHVGICLTDAQKKQMACAGVKPCDYVEVTSIGLRYGIVLPPTVKYGLPPVVKYALPTPSKRKKK